MKIPIGCLLAVFILSIALFPGQAFAFETVPADGVTAEAALTQWTSASMTGTPSDPHAYVSLGEFYIKPPGLAISYVSLGTPVNVPLGSNPAYTNPHGPG